MAPHGCSGCKSKTHGCCICARVTHKPKRRRINTDIPSTKPDCAKCGRPYHVGRYIGGAYGSDCDGYEPVQSDTDIPSSKEHGGRLAELHPAEQRVMQLAAQIQTLTEAYKIIIREAAERSDYDGDDYSAHLRLTGHAYFRIASEYLQSCLTVLGPEHRAALAAVGDAR